ncbi:MAG: response regulator [Nanoarchaeota archaeon]
MPAKKKTIKTKKKTIMVVDDEADIRDTVEEVLKKNGYDVITAVSADDCLNKLKSATPDLILLDIMMPGTPVRIAAPKMKAKIAFLSVVRVSEAEKEDLLKSKNVVGFVQKPFDIDELLKKVKKLTEA